MYLVLSLRNSRSYSHFYISSNILLFSGNFLKIPNYTTGTNYSSIDYYDGCPSHHHILKDPQPQRIAASQKQVIDEEDSEK
jgi:hypothetical protein